MIPAMTAQPLQRPVHFNAAARQQPANNLVSVDSLCFGSRPKAESPLHIQYGPTLTADMKKHPEKYANFQEQIESQSAFPQHYPKLITYLRQHGWSIELELERHPALTFLQGKLAHVDAEQGIIRIQVKTEDPAKSLRQDIVQGIARAVNVDGLGQKGQSTLLSNDPSFKDNYIAPLMNRIYETSDPKVQQNRYNIGRLSGHDPRRDPSGKGFFEHRVAALLLGEKALTPEYQPETPLYAAKQAVDLLLAPYQNQ